MMPTTTTAIRLVTAQLRDMRGQHHVHDQHDHRDEIEDAVREHGSKQARPGAGLPHAPVQHRHPRQLADAPRQHRVREQADGERGEDEHEARVGRFERLHDHGAPRKRTHEHREQVQADRSGDPAPLDRC